MTLLFHFKAFLFTVEAKLLIGHRKLYKPKPPLPLFLLFLAMGRAEARLLKFLVWIYTFPSPIKRLTKPSPVVNPKVPEAMEMW